MQSVKAARMARKSARRANRPLFRYGADLHKAFICRIIKQTYENETYFGPEASDEMVHDFTEECAGRVDGIHNGV